MRNNKQNKTKTRKQFGEVKSFQEIYNETSKNSEFKHNQPTPQPQDFDEIEY
ncbi:hypothetical protein [Oceanobacillus bengalensis]|uniref:hypothetical protein n=1 Tax=Oceanobacillus bengalensis TaxID=1435466 RepID=UPI0015FF2D2C|nr:hypothetical protein [Oceanobacillus bengalensis]